MPEKHKDFRRKASWKCQLGVANLLNKKGRILINKSPKALDTNLV